MRLSGSASARRTRRRVAGRPRPRPRSRTRFVRVARRSLLAVGLLAAAGLLGAGGVHGVRWLVAHPALAVREVLVTGAEKASVAEITTLAGIVPGEPWLALDLAGARLRVRTHPWVEDVRLHRPAPGRVRVDVREFRPIAAVEVAGSRYGITRELAIVPEASGGALPLIAGVFTKGVQEVDVLEELLARGVAYVGALGSLGFLEGRRVELLVGPSAPDRIRLEGGAFTAVVEGVIPPSRVARNVTAFLEKLDDQDEVRGTLRLVSATTAVWRADNG